MTRLLRKAGTGLTAAIALASITSAHAWEIGIGDGEGACHMVAESADKAHALAISVRVGQGAKLIVHSDSITAETPAHVTVIVTNSENVPLLSVAATKTGPALLVGSLDAAQLMLIGKEKARALGLGGPSPVSQTLHVNAGNGIAFDIDAAGMGQVLADTLDCANASP
jgi:hypothetical protein